MKYYLWGCLNEGKDNNVRYYGNNPSLLCMSNDKFAMLTHGNAILPTVQQVNILVDLYNSETISFVVHKNDNNYYTVVMYMNHEQGVANASLFNFDIDNDLINRDTDEISFWTRSKADKWSAFVLVFKFNY